MVSPAQPIEKAEDSNVRLHTNVNNGSVAAVLLQGLEMLFSQP